MAKLKLSVAFGNYDRTRALIDGRVQIDGVDPIYMNLGPEEVFFRAFRGVEFDICELSMSSFTVKTAQGNCPYVGVPAFLSRTFRHTSIFVRKDRIKQPSDLKGRRVGAPEYQLTANVWARDILESECGVKPSDLIWVRGGYEQPGRPEKITLNLPKDIRIEDAPETTTLSAMLAAGEIDGLVGPRVPSSAKGNPNIGWLFPDPAQAARDYYKRTGIFPIMHLVGVRRELAEQHPWLPGAVFKAFEQSRVIAMAELRDTSAIKVMLPFVEEELQIARALMGEDYWTYGLEANRKVIETFTRLHHAQGLSPRPLTPEEMFHPSTHESFKL